MKKLFKISALLVALFALIIMPNTSVARAAESETEKVRIHYCRDDENYKNWNLWLWAYKPVSGEGSEYYFTGEDDYGVYSEIDMKNDALLGTSTTIGFLVKKSDGSNKWADRDVVEDRFIEIPATSENGIYNIYLYQGFSQVYKTADEAKNDKIKTAAFSNMTTLVVDILTEDNITSDKFRVYADDVLYDNYKFSYTKNKITATFNEEVDLQIAYTIEIAFTSGTRDMSVDKSKLYDFPQFYENFTYYGDDLGVTFSNDHKNTTFKLWAPLATKVVLNLYTTGTPKEYAGFGDAVSSTPSHRILMHKEQQGVWAHTEYANLHGVYYTYSVYFGTRFNEVVDPYAKSAGVNGERGLIVDFDKLNSEIGFTVGDRPDVIKNATDAIIYESHVRDLTKDVTWGGNPEKAGKYLGFVEEGTTYTENGVTVSTGFDHLKELGITHVQLMPIYDVASINESLAEPNFNWGYDPLNYNVLEGSYSSNPFDGLVRIREFKQMVMKLTKAGIAINMDVVFNHTARSSNSNFNMIVPNYYHRMNNDGTYRNESGCGNELASQRPMVRKFILDSTKFWLSEYNLSGFRFDLMGLIDTTTMEQVYEQCAEVYNHVMVYGEPWGGYGASYSGYRSTNQSTLKGIAGVGAFNDKIRDAVKGGNNDGSKGFVQGSTGSTGTVVNGIKGTFDGSSVDPTRVINYVACHDNLTLRDKIATEEGVTATGANNKEATIKARNNQSDSIVLLSEGIPFIQLGQDFLRSKPMDPNSDYGEANRAGYDHNSYRSTDYTNSIKWNLKLKNRDVFNYYKDLIALRRAHAGLRLATNSAVNSALSIKSGSGTTIGYTINYGGEELYIIHSVNGGNYNLNGSYRVIFNKNGAVSGAASTSYTLSANESVVLVKA
ncbi:MAG: type I pullulanase [Erysipelotrichales bacterium]|nr:type I pullulanase [Erysipelotrichales bacterium]